MTGDDIYALLAPRLQAVLALDGPPPREARFDTDLRADSLDLVEVVEGIEAELISRGHRIRLPDDVLLSLATVGEAAEALAALTGGGRG